MPDLKRNKQPVPRLSSDGIPIHSPQPLALDHPHCVIAKAGFWAGFVSHPGGLISAGRTWVPEGMLADDRSPLVKKHRGQFRRPTKEERAA